MNKENGMKKILISELEKNVLGPNTVHVVRQVLVVHVRVFQIILLNMNDL